MMRPHTSSYHRRLAALVGLGALAVAAGRPLDAAEPLVDLTEAVVLAPSGQVGPAAKAPALLVEEVGKRSLARWTRVDDWPVGSAPVILVGPLDGVRRLAEKQGVRLPDPLAPVGREGYQLGVARRGSAPVVWIAGDDPRGVLFGAGRLLRALSIERRRVTLPSGFAIASAPQTPLRGMQLGYRPKTNSYDGWTVAMWEQYLRDLVVFGCNAVELIPPRSDDEDDSPHFPLPKAAMMTEMSRLADAYGLDVWAWYPAMDADYRDRRTVEFALREWGNVFRSLPRLDALFVPGGDPGHTPPKVLLALLEAQAANLHKVHPNAQVWISPQGFTRPWMDEFFSLLDPGPSWLAGVVYGPQVRMDLPEFRRALPSRYPIRDYPDITHSRHCQYPVPDWDVAFAVTQGREVANPRPERMAAIFRRSRPHTRGFIGYSEGCHDDVNKMLWLALGWDERADVGEVLREYARYFIGPAHEARFASGLLGLERNWQGPALANTSIGPTMELFRGIERDGGPKVARNWRFQLAHYRACYDAYVQARLRDETAREAAAKAALRDARTLGALAAIDQARAILDRPAAPEIAPLRARLLELAEALFQSIVLQLSVSKYQAIAIERGASLDMIDGPLTDAGWLHAQLAAVRGLDDEAARLARIDTVLGRTDPGPGGFYDDLGDPANQPHLVRGSGADDDPAYYASSLVGFGFRNPGPDRARPRAWWSHAESLYDAPLLLRYSGLDRSAAYRVRVVYAQERRTSKVHLTADDRFEIHGSLARPFEPLEFAVPPAATSDGKLTLQWNQEPGTGGSGRGCQVSEVWLLKVGGGG